MRDSLPATGAWVPGDSAGDRQFANVSVSQFHCDSGESLPEVTLAYETWGTPNSQMSNAVLVCHALTGDSHAVGRSGTAHPTPGWWSGLIGPGLGIDTDRWFVVCSNVLGGCQGSTGPAHPDPRTGEPYAARFPMVTIRDMVRAQTGLARHLGVRRWAAVVGGSMGGMQALEWAIMAPEQVGALVVYSTTVAASAQQIAWSLAGRRAIEADDGFNGGDYYSEGGTGPQRGLAAARIVGHVTYRSNEVYDTRFGRKLIARSASDREPAFDVESYLDYQGAKFVSRFDANSYIRLNRAMDLHDIGWRRGGAASALSRIGAPVLVGSVRSDFLYPPEQQRQLASMLDHHTMVEWHEVDSEDGHDGFLIATDQLGPRVGAFLERWAPT